jgi:hypothetical protein
MKTSRFFTALAASLLCCGSGAHSQNQFEVGARVTPFSGRTVVCLSKDDAVSLVVLHNEEGLEQAKAMFNTFNVEGRCHNAEFLGVYLEKVYETSVTRKDGAFVDQVVIGVVYVVDGRLVTNPGIQYIIITLPVVPPNTARKL